jgi:hypothetical protein
MDDGLHGPFVPECGGHGQEEILTTGRRDELYSRGKPRRLPAGYGESRQTSEGPETLQLRRPRLLREEWCAAIGRRGKDDRVFPKEIQQFPSI